MFTSMSLDYSKFYNLTDPLATRPLRLSDEGYSEWLTREQAWMLFRGNLELGHPLRLGAYQGGQATDFLWAGLVHIICISSRVVELLTEHRITGWATYPVEVYGREGEPLPGYHGFSVTGPECKRDRSRSQIIEKPPPSPRGQSYQVYKGLYFDESQWDGSDIFLVRPFGGIVVTEKVYKLFKRNRVSNVRLIPLPKVEIDVILDEYEG